ncbi:MAG: DUF3015 family protein [Bdellovibrionia bacterium]
MGLQFKLSIVLFLSAIFCLDAHTFNWRKCKSNKIDTRGDSFHTQIVSGIFDYSYSTAQFITSTGECSAIGMSSDERAQLFYAFNYDKVLEDIAKNRGEYLASFEKILGCKVEFSKLRNNYDALSRASIEEQFYAVRGSCHN